MNVTHSETWRSQSCDPHAKDRGQVSSVGISRPSSTWKAESLTPWLTRRSSRRNRAGESACFWPEKYPGNFRYSFGIFSIRQNEGIVARSPFSSVLGPAIVAHQI